MRAGKLRRRFHLQSPTTSATRDDMGGKSVTYSTTATVWAGTVNMSGPIGGGEDVSGGLEQAHARATFRLRHRDGVTGDYRLVNADSTGEVWDITSALDPTGKRRELHVEAVRRGV